MPSATVGISGTAGERLAEHFLVLLSQCQLRGVKAVALVAVKFLIENGQGLMSTVARQPIVDVRGAFVALVSSRASVNHGGEVARVSATHPGCEARLVRGGAVEGQCGDAVAEEKPGVSRCDRHIVDVDLGDLDAVRAGGGRPRHHELDPAPPGEVKAVRLF